MKQVCGSLKLELDVDAATQALPNRGAAGQVMECLLLVSVTGHHVRPTLFELPLPLSSTLFLFRPHQVSFFSESELKTPNRKLHGKCQYRSHIR
ncbi:ATP synthase F0 subunit 1 [Iris pallida]|uniref:ATP synthase F0 subunit 1 (Mitochondrion) n=1 Tax=Iris pallida TaxID=29817 RepID=A0AAX6GMJ4_IRIPA|nr:ATP synthase F0 subunit 1 [Iris pallida]